MTRSSYYSKAVCNQEQVLMTQVGYTECNAAHHFFKIVQVASFQRC